MKNVAILGYPLRHTLSPEIHRLLAEILQEEITYQILEIPSEELAGSLPALMALDGFNITIPYKVKMMTQMDLLDKTAETHGAVNVAARKTDGRHTGYNTDCLGFVRTMEAEGVEIAGRVCVVGAGGVGRMFATECASRGCRVTLAVREGHRKEAEQLAGQLQQAYPKATAEACEIGKLSGSFDLLIQATPVGMFPNTEATPIPQEKLCGVKTVFDCIYNPAQTRLMREAAEVGCLVFGGMKMLVWQAAAAEEIWFDRRFTAEQVNSVIVKMER